MLNVLELVGGLHGAPDLLAGHRRITSYWEAAHREPVNARVIAEQLAALQPPSGAA